MTVSPASRDDLVEGAQQQELRPKRPARRRWLGAVAAVLAVALVAGYFFWPAAAPPPPTPTP